MQGPALPDFSGTRSLYAENAAVKKEYDAQMVASGLMSHKEELADLQSVVTQQQALTDASFNQQIGMYSTLDAEYQKLMNQKMIADERFHIAHMKLTQQGVDEENKQWKQISSVVERNMDSMVKGVMTGSQTMYQAFGRMLGNLIISFSEAVVKMGVEWAAGEL